MTGTMYVESYVATQHLILTKNSVRQCQNILTSSLFMVKEAHNHVFFFKMIICRTTIMPHLINEASIHSSQNTLVYTTIHMSI